MNTDELNQSFETLGVGGTIVSYGIAIAIITFWCAIYCLPCIIMTVRKKKHNTNAIAAINLLFGWTCIGYLVSFVWALMDDPVEYQQQVQQPNPQVPSQSNNPKASSGELNTMGISPRNENDDFDL